FRVRVELDRQVAPCRVAEERERQVGHGDRDRPLDREADHGRTKLAIVVPAKGGTPRSPPPVVPAKAGTKRPPPPVVPAKAGTQRSISLVVRAKTGAQPWANADVRLNAWRAGPHLPLTAVPQPAPGQRWEVTIPPTAGSPPS